MNKSFKLLFGFAVCALAASSAPACGGDDDGGGSSGSGGKDAGPDTASGGSGGSGATGGSGGSGGSGATGGSGGSGGSATITCGAESCKGYSVVIAELAPCCAGSNKDKCGVDVDESAAGALGIQPGCIELGQAGNLDTSCSSFTVPGVGITLPGCCNAGASKCSYMVDVSGFGGPNIGCVDPASLPASDAGPPAACTPGQPGDGGSDAATDAASDAASDAAADSATDATAD